MDTKDIIIQAKQKKLLKDNPTAKQVAEVVVSEMLESTIFELTAKVELAIIELQSQDFTGEKGDKPIGGIDYPLPEDGQDGKDYVLTENDKLEIAQKIEVPTVEKVVEKIEVIKEQPIITNEIKEIAKYEEPEQIAEKLNTLEEKVEKKVIKGLEDELRILRQGLREKRTVGGSGGGGMGNVQHESVSVSSATTSISTTYNIAGSGFALWAYYQGQMIARGVGYSAPSGKTIPILFTPTDGTFIDLVYIRT